MNMHTPIFSNDANSTQFNSLIGTSAGLKAKFGDPDNVDTHIAGQVRVSHGAIKRGLEKIERLGDDDTRSMPERHEAARTVANQTIATLETARQAFTARGNELQAEGQRLLDEFFAPDPARAFYDSKRADWIGERAKTETGIAEIREAIPQDPILGSVIINSPSYILGLAEKTAASLYFHAVKTHVPQALALSEQGSDIHDLATKYSKNISAIRRGWFNNAMADRAKSRVSLTD